MTNPGFFLSPKPVSIGAQGEGFGGFDDKDLHKDFGVQPPPSRRIKPVSEASTLNPIP